VDSSTKLDPMFTAVPLSGGMVKSTVSPVSPCGTVKPLKCCTLRPVAFASVYQRMLTSPLVPPRKQLMVVVFVSSHRTDELAAPAPALAAWNIIIVLVVSASAGEMPQVTLLVPFASVHEPVITALSTVTFWLPGV